MEQSSLSVTFNSLLDQLDSFSSVSHFLLVQNSQQLDWYPVCGQYWWSTQSRWRPHLHSSQNGSWHLQRGLRCCYGRPFDPTGLHSLSCYLNAGCFACHTELNLIIKWALTQVNSSSVLKLVGLFGSNGKKPDSLTLCPRGKRKGPHRGCHCLLLLCSSLHLGCCNRLEDP